MDPGSLDTRILIVRDGETGRDGAGAPIAGRVEVAAPWARVTHQGGREFLAGEGQASERRVVFRIYPLAGVDTDCIVVHGGQDHPIVDVRPFDDAMELHTVGKAAVAPT